MPRARMLAMLVLLGAVMGALNLANAQSAPPQKPQMLDSNSQQMVHQMLHDAYSEVRKHYYDPKLHGLDWDARYAEFEARLKNAKTLGESFTVVAAYLEALKDSHTYFTPPERATRFNSGYRMKMIGNSCFVTQIRPKSDAEAKLHVGDEILHYDQYNLNREDFTPLRYYYSVLAPHPAVQLDLQGPQGERRRVVVNTMIQQRKRVTDLTDSGDFWDYVRQGEMEDHASRQQFADAGDVGIWKVPEFFMTIGELDNMMGRARKHPALVLDLRGNPGGAMVTLQEMLGSIFDHEVKIADLVGRKPSKPLVAKPQQRRFDGKIVVLVDSDSGSAAELFAREMQLEKRGTVVGDRTAGAVMESLHYQESVGTDTKIFYGFSVTENDLIMKDGKSLEKVGVTPDEIMLPSASDLAAGRDPVLAHAVELVGGKLDPTAAGKLFPVEWLPL